MANRSKTLSFHAQTLKACRQKKLLMDRFSELPDEIIVSVLSLLTMKEAGRTSVLSKRWRYVWAYIPVLNFDGLDTLYKLMLDETSLEVEKPRYLRWVNQVVESYKGPFINEFRVQFDIDISSGNSIDNWVKFAMERAVKRLDLNFDPHVLAVHNKCYTFCDLLISNSITSLKLASVDVTGEVLQNFLEVCRSLEYLSVTKSKSIVNLKVSGAKLNLKYLEINKCPEVKHIEIFAPNLVSVKYSGPKISTYFKSTPKLSTLLIGGDYSENLTNNFLKFPSCLFQLEELSLEIPFGIKNGMKSVDQFPLCKRLKQLELTVHPLDDDKDLLCFAPLIKACPFLHKFVLKDKLGTEGPLGTEENIKSIKRKRSEHNGTIVPMERRTSYLLLEMIIYGKLYQKWLRWIEPRSRRRQIKSEPFRHEHLKIVEIGGFVGNAMDIAFIMYLIASCVALEKLVIDLRDPFEEGTPWEFEMDDNKRRAREQAEKFRAELEPGVELIIL